MPSEQAGEPTGGRALKFYSPVRLDVRRIETLKDGADAVGNRIRIKVVKNKLFSPFRQAEVDLIFGQGISREGALIGLGVEQGIVRKSGAWYTYEGDHLGQGKENARGFLRDNLGLAGEIEKKIKEKLGVGPRLDADPGAARGMNVGRVATDIIQSGGWVTVLSVDRGQKIPSPEDRRYTRQCGLRSHSDVRRRALSLSKPGVEEAV
jgi:hypothetical protein